jgi:hypothetical protein
MQFAKTAPESKKLRREAGAWLKTLRAKGIKPVYIDDSTSPAVRLAMVAASSPASAGVVCIFQLPATITGRMR